MSTPALNGVFGQIFIGGARYLTVGPASFSAPLGTSFLPIQGSAEPFLTSRGMQEPVVTARLLCRDNVGTAGSGSTPGIGNPLSDTFLALVFGRNTLPTYDSTMLGIVKPGSAPTLNLASMVAASVAFTDGGTVVLMYGAKIATWRMSGAKAGVVTVDVTIVGTGFYRYDMGASGDATDLAITAMMPTTGQCANPLWFNAFTFNEAYLAGKVFNFDINYSNNLDPNRALDGTYNPAEQNSMSPSGTMSLTLQPLDGTPGDHSGATGGTATLIITNPAADKTVTLSMNNLKSTAPDNRSGQTGRLLRSFSYLLGGDCDNLNNAAGRIIVPSSSDF